MVVRKLRLEIIIVIIISNIFFACVYDTTKEAKKQQNLELVQVNYSGDTTSETKYSPKRKLFLRKEEYKIIKEIQKQLNYQDFGDPHLQLNNDTTYRVDSLVLYNIPANFSFKNIRQLQNLQTLKIVHGYLEDLKVLESISRLADLKLSSCSYPNRYIKIPQGLRELKKLEIWGTIGIQDIIFPKNAQLRFLVLRVDILEMPQSMDRLTKLDTLVLHTNIRNFDVSYLKNLKYIKFYGLKAMKIDTLQLKKKHPKIHIDFSII